MGIITNIFKSRDKPQNATSGSAFRFFIGNSSSGKAVAERSAMQMTAVYSCVRILSEAVASLPLHVYRYNGEGGKEKAVDHPLYFLLHDEPNPEMTSFVFRETLMTHLLLWGNAYAQIIRNGKGEVVALYPLMPNRMVVNSLMDKIVQKCRIQTINEVGDWIQTECGGNVLSEGIDADGGYLVPEEYDSRLIEGLEEENIFRRLGTTITTSGERKINIAGSKPAAAWIDEGKALTFGDFSYYNIGDRGVRSFAELKELFAGNGMVGFVAKERVDGKLVLPEAVQILKMGA